jgi:glycosyltransferase involved in cell wall biosynthesis
MDSPKFSVIIITRNRASFLPRVLESVINQDYEKEKYEIIVVDNNSSDSTTSIVERFKRRCPNRICYAFEPKIGMSNARNRGAETAKGEILLFIDDDAIASTNWLTNHGHLYQSFPDIVATGGKIELTFISKKPKWISEELLVTLGYLDLSHKETIISFPYHPFGVNFSVKKEQLIKLKGFRGELKSYNDEKAFFYKLYLNKYKVGYSPRALVYHQIPTSRLRKVFFIKRGIKQGIGNIKFNSIFDPIRIPRFKSKLNRLLLEWLIIIRNILFYRDKYSFTQMYYLCIRWGELFGIIMRRFATNEYRSYSDADETS